MKRVLPIFFLVTCAAAQTVVVGGSSEGGGGGSGCSIGVDCAPVGAVSVVTYSDSPQFDLGTTGANIRFQITLTGNVTSPTFANLSAGRKFSVAVKQDGTGGRSFAWPVGTLNACGVVTTLNVTTTAQLEVDDSGAPNTTDCSNDGTKLAIPSTIRFEAISALSSAPIKTGVLADRPATCAAGDLYLSTDEAAGENIHACPATNTWVKLTGIKRLSVTWDGGGSALTAGTSAAYARCTRIYSGGSILAWWGYTDTGTATMKLWRSASAMPTNGDSMNTSGLGLTSTEAYSTTLSDFTSTTLATGDRVCSNLAAVGSNPTLARLEIYYR